MSKGLIDILLDQIFDADWKGRRGEKLTERELKWVRLFGRDGKVLRNVYIPKGDGETSEIDVMYITQKGIFVIESKNYSGWIFGNEADRNWTVSLPNGQKNRFYNPIMQNRGHIKWLSKYLADDVLDGTAVNGLYERLKLLTHTNEAKRGANAGNQFYGCSNYPKCRFTKDV